MPAPFAVILPNKFIGLLFTMPALTTTLTIISIKLFKVAMKLVSSYQVLTFRLLRACWIVQRTFLICFTKSFMVLLPLFPEIPLTSAGLSRSHRKSLTKNRLMDVFTCQL